MTKDRFDIHQQITDQIVAAIERGAGEFQLPWRRTNGNITRPTNISSKKPYRGVNIVALWAASDASGYQTGLWGTYRQWAEAGAQVRKGEKAAYVVFYKEIEAASEYGEHDEIITRLFARATPVSAAEQVVLRIFRQEQSNAPTLLSRRPAPRSFTAENTPSIGPQPTRSNFPIGPASPAPPRARPMRPTIPPCFTS